MARMTKDKARDIAERHGLDLSLDYYETDSAMRGRLSEAAKEWKYRDPKSPLGRSRLYCFWLFLQRKAEQ